MLFTVLIKETKHLLNDKGFIAIALILPIIFIIMFGSSFQSGDITNLSTVVIDEDKTNFSKYVINSVNDSKYFNIVPSSDSLEENLVRLNKSEIRALFFIPEGFEEKLNKSESAEIIVYVDSSNFITYASISSAKLGILGDTLKEVSEDILGGFEEEKEESKEKIDDVKRIFEEIEKENELFQIDLDNLKEQTDSIDVSGLENLNDDIKTYLNNQTESINQTINYFDLLINQLTTLRTFNQTEEQKKYLLILQFSVIRNSINSSQEGISELIEKIDEIDISSLGNLTISKKIEERTAKMKDLFEEADRIASDININFERLEKEFLSEPVKMTEVANFGPLRYFDYLGPGILSLMVFFVSLMIPSLNIISEKEKNTLYRISTTPASSLSIFIGKFIVFIIFGFIEMIYALLLAIFIYNIRIDGSVYNVILVLFLLSCSGISLGLFISSKLKTMQQSLLIVPLIVIPSFLISHSFFPPDIMAKFMNYVAYATPMTFSNNALTSIMIKGFSLNDILSDVYVLIGFIIVPLVLFIWSYRKMKY